MGKQGPCCHCGISTTPLWRNGPPEKPVLCNACGSRWRTKGTLLNYMPMHSGGCGVSDSPDYKWPRGKRGPQKFKEQRSHKRKEPCDAHQDVEFRAMKSNLQYARVLDEDVSTRSSSVSGITNSEGCMQHGCAAEKDNTVHTSVWDSPVPSKKRTCMFRQRPSSVEKLTKGMQYILQEQDSSYLSSSSEEDLLYEYKPPLVAVEIGLGSVFIRQPQSAIKEEESEASSLLIENKGCNTFDVLTQAYSGAVVPPGHLPYGDKIVTERWKENMELLQEHSAKSFIPNKALLESFLRSCHSPLIFMDLKDIVNFDTFTELLKDEEQMQLLKYVSSVDDSAVPESLKCMFTSVQFKGALSNFQQLLSEGMFDMYGSGLSPQVQQFFQQLLLVTDLTKSKWMDRYSHLQLRFKRRGLVDSAKHPENKDATKPKGPNLLGSLPKSAVHAALKDSSGRPPPGHSFAGSEKDKKNPVCLQRSGPATVYPFTPIWTNSSTDGGCYESIDTGSTSKELDSYLASGMLTEIPKLSISQSMMMCASTTSAETSGDRIVEATMEEISECSQDSSATGCYHSGSFEAATTSPVGHEIFELQKAGEDGILNDELKDLTQHHLSKCSKTDGASLESEEEIGLSEVPVDQEVQTVTSNEMNEFFESVIAGSSCSVGSPRECTNTVNVSDCVGSSCFRVQPFVPTAVAEHMMTSSFSYTYQLSSSIDMVATSPSLCANPFSVSGSPLHSVAYDTMLSSLVNTGGASCSPEIPASAFNSSICNDGGYLQCASEFYRSDQLSQDCLPLIQDLKIDTRDEQPRPAVCSLSSIANGINQCNRMAEISNIETENADTGSLFYEPPRLPNWDMPFVNCDLISTCNYLQQAYSPLGVRQMIMSSVNCSTPAYFPWNSPCNDKSPEAVLKSAAKSFANTPSILRKRQREASTPVHRNQSDKKVDNVPDYDCFFTPTSSVQKDCALLRSAAVHLRTCSVEDGAIFSSNERGIILSPPYCLKSRSTAAATSEEKHIDYDSENSKQLKAVYEGCNANIEEGPCCSESSTRRIDRGVDAMDRMNGETVMEKVKTSGVLVEQNMNGNDLFTPGGNISLKHSSPNSCRGTPKTLFARRMEMSSKSGDSKGHLKRIQGTACFPCVISPNLCEKKQDIRADNVTSSFETSAARSPIDNVFDKDWLNNVPDLDSFNIMSATFNLDKDLGSPLEWKSPWSLDTPLSAHKDGADGIFEDMGIFINNPDGSDDALGLMKELNEHVASSYMEAEEILNGEHAKRLVAKTITSTKSSKASLSEDKTSCKENINFSDQNFQGENCTTISNYNPANYSPSNINAINTPSRGGLSEGQMNQSFVGNISDFSSPSLYLLRECR